MTTDHYVKKDSILYVCMPTRNGLKCGKCLYGNVGMFKVTRDCLVCGAKKVRAR
jgi:hypothetical protein